MARNIIVFLFIDYCIYYIKKRQIFIYILGKNIEIYYCNMYMQKHKNILLGSWIYESKSNEFVLKTAYSSQCVF